MRYRKMSPSGDYTFGGGELNFYRDVPEAVGQAVGTRILLWLGEWYFDTGEGTPFLQGILGKHSKEVADITLQTRILETENMVSIENYESTINPETRLMTVTCDINTIYGPTELEVSNYVNF